MKGKEMKPRQYANEQGYDAIWAGPLDVSMMPKGKGSSNGSNGIKLLAKNQPACARGPVTERAKGFNY